MSPAGEAKARSARRRAIAHAADTPAVPSAPTARRGRRMSPAGEAKARSARRRAIAHAADTPPVPSAPTARRGRRMSPAGEAKARGTVSVRSDARAA